MNIYDAFPSDYLKAADLADDEGPRKVKIANVTMEQIGEDNKLVLHFAGNATKKMICNRTNSLTIAEAFGPETDNWIGAVIVLFGTKVPFQGKLVDALRVSVPKQKPAQAAPVNVVPNARARQAMVDMGDNPAAPLDDEIPF